MAYLMTSKELVDEGRALVKKGVLYGSGFQLDTITTSKVNSKAKQYPDKYNTPKKSAKYYPQTMYEHLLENANQGKWAADCCGWIKGEEYGRRANDNSASYKSSMDLTISKMASGCTEKSTDKNKLVEGMFMWSDDYSHCAIYSGNGKDIESAPSLDGMAEVSITYQGGNCKLVNWGKLPWVNYNTNTQVASTTTSSAKKGVTKTIYNCYALNIRKGPGTIYKVITSYKAGTKVTVYEIKGTWARIGDGMWCSNKYLK